MTRPDYRRMNEWYRATLASKGTVLVPRKAPSVRGGLWIYGSTRELGVLANRITGRLAGLSSKLIPGRDVAWEPPLDDVVFGQWIARAEASLRSEISSWVVQLPQDLRRRRFNLLLLDSSGRPIGFAKFTMNPLNPMSLAALSRFREDPPRSFWAPSLFFADELGGFSSVLTSAMPNVPHGPAHISAVRSRAVINEIRERLDDLAAPNVAVHGDFAPWNVRTFAHGEVAVIDWEELGPGVVGADELWFLISSGRAHDRQGITRAFFEGRSYSVGELRVAANFWLDRLNRAEPDEVDPSQRRNRRVRLDEQRVHDTLEQIVSSG